MNHPHKLIRIRLIGQIILPLVFSLGLLIIGYYITNPAVNNLLKNEREETVKEMVNSIYNLIENYNDRVNKGELTINDAKTIVLNNIKEQRYGKNRSNYFWIEDYSGHFIYHPFLETPKFITPEISKSMQSVALQVGNLINRQSSGFITYQWYTPSNISISSTKVAYAKGNRKWDWIICTGFMLTDIEEDVKQITSKMLVILFLFLGCLLVILSFVIYFNYKNLHKIEVTDNELKKIETLFKGFIKYANQGVMIFENENPVFVNSQFGKIFNIADVPVSYFKLENYLPGWERERVKIILNSADKRVETKFETWLLPDAGNEKYVTISISYDDNIIYKYMIVQDITEEHRTHTTIDILSENLAQSPDSIVITDLNGNIEYVNPGFEKATGYTFEELKGQNPRILKSNKMSQVIYDDLWKTITSGQIWKGEMLNRKKDGSMFWESTIIFPIKNRQNEIIKYSSIKTDISKTKQIEQELIAAKNKAEVNERLKTAFLNNVSHEVRTPLNAIFGFTQILKSSFSYDEFSINYLKIMEKNCQILLHLFEDI